MPELIQWLTTTGFDLFMQLSRLLLDYLKVIVWPAVVLTLVLVYKRPIIGVLARLRKASGLGYALELDARALAEAAELAEATEDAAAVSGTPPIPDIVGADGGAPVPDPAFPTTNNEAQFSPTDTPEPETEPPALSPFEAAQRELNSLLAEDRLESRYRIAWNEAWNRDRGIAFVLNRWNTIAEAANTTADLLNLKPNLLSPAHIAHLLSRRGYMSPNYAVITERLQRLRNDIVHAREEVTTDVIDDFAATSTLVREHFEKARRRILLDQKLLGNGDPDPTPDSDSDSASDSASG